MSRHPVILATGEKSLDHLDFELPGPISLAWRRHYRSGDGRSDGWFGQGWSHPWATELWLQEDLLRYWDEQGREAILPAIDVGQQHFQAYEQFTLLRPGADHWVLQFKSGHTHHFRRRHAAQWRLALEVVQDRNLRRVWLQFDEADFGSVFDAQGTAPRPRRLVDSVGRTLHLVWTDHQQLGQVVVESGATRVTVAEYRYCLAEGGVPDLASHTDPNGDTRSFTWEQHLLTGYRLATGQRFSNRYDRLAPTGRVIESLALDDGTGDWFDYNGRTTRVRDRLGRETVYVHNSRQDIVAVHDAAGHVMRIEFDAEGRPAASTDALGRSASTQFDHRGNLVLVVDPAGNATQIEYNALDLPVKLVDALGGVWLQRYDARGNLIAHTDPLGHTTLLEVDTLGRVTAVIDALDKRKTLEWDEAGNVVAYTDCSGHTTRQTYDDLGRMTSSTDALGQTTTTVFDAAGRLRQMTQADGAQHHYMWDAQENLLRYADPLGRTITWQRNGAGAPVLRFDALGQTQRYAYDHAGRMTSVTNENGELARFAYDALDNVTDEVGFDGRHTRATYNAAGEVTHVIERGGSDVGPGKVTRFERDALGQVIARTHVGEGPGPSASARFAYDAMGQMTQASNAVSKLKFAYDPLGQLVAESQMLQASLGARTFEFKHRYDPLGNRTWTQLPDGRELNRLFYGSGHLHQVNLDGQVVSDFERDALYREVRRSQGAMRSEFAYDRVDRLSAQRVLRASAAESAGPVSGLDALGFPAPPAGAGLGGSIERHYQYDLGGQLVQWVDRHRGLTRYRYDAISRITRAQIGLSRDWGALGVAIGAPGNATGQPMAANERFSWDPASNPVPEAAEPGAYVPGNRLRVWQDASYAYDVHGNLVERLQGKRASLAQVRTHLTWDAAHQLVRADVARGPDGSASLRSFAYVYDAIGRRIAKSDGNQTSFFAWDGDLLVLEEAAGRSVTHIHHPESFVPLAQLHDGVLHHLHTDHLGTPLEASNDAGEITWQVTYRAWGSVLAEEVKQIEQKLRFQGQYVDDETGLHYNRFRYYDPAPGRFISEDPIGLDGGINLFQYGPNPITWVDPLGLTFAHVTFPKSKVIKEVTIKMQGSRDKDFGEANRKKKIYGCRGKPTQDSHKYQYGEVTWHHKNYNKKTNTAVMQLVKTVDHEAKFPHAGSVSDFEKAHKVDYDTDAAVNKAKKLNKKCPCKKK